MKLHVIILAAGKGTRMKSALPKVLAPLATKPLLWHVIKTAKNLDAESINIVIGHGSEKVKHAFADETINWCMQTEQKGTGHAVKQGLPDLPDEDAVLILYGDVPLIGEDSLQKLIAGLSENAETRKNDLAVLTAMLDNPHGYGRITHDSKGNMNGIVEHKDANLEELKIHEINTGILAANIGKLKKWLAEITTNNAQGEEYLTDIVGVAYQQNDTIFASQPNSIDEINGINSKVELAAIERRFQKIQADKCLREGLTIIDPSRFDLRGNLSFGQDCLVDINAIFNGEVQLGNNVTIHANCVLSDCKIDDNTTIHPNTVLESCSIGANANIGPFARIRPGTQLANDTKIGNFVELKNTQLAQGSKVNHLSYVGDSEVGVNTNIGAGVITCNYDGANKHKTIIGNNAFIGSNSQLVAPVTIADNATIAAGSTITQAVPEQSLAVARSKQRNINGWKRPIKKS
jgi:bifunctional UDP-N-acetylglucosamine pyrophosphorylase/glucosamine-1-phosphate N-acetyltransferase